MKLLIVDDSKFSQLITSKILKAEFPESEIIFANDGEDGFKKYQTHRPHYAFIDLLMPKLNGKELIKLIKEYDPDAKLFVISADVQKGVKAELQAAGIMAFINKPFNDEKAKRVFKMMRNDKHE